MTADEVFEKYRERFGVELFGPPLDFGHVDMPLELLTQYGEQALEAGEPINWSKHFRLIPDGAKS